MAIPAIMTQQIFSKIARRHQAITWNNVSQVHDAIGRYKDQRVRPYQITDFSFQIQNRYPQENKPMSLINDTVITKTYDKRYCEGNYLLFSRAQLRLHNSDMIVETPLRIATKATAIYSLTTATRY